MTGEAPRQPPAKTLTKLEQMAVIERLTTDPVYFIESCLSIIDQNQKRVPFILNPVQRLYSDARSERDDITKSRKHGISSEVDGMILHACAFREHTRAVIISHEEEATKKLLRRVKDFRENSIVKIDVKEDSSTEMFFPGTRSWLYIGTAGSKAFGRGDDITIAHLSEHAHYRDQAVMTGVLEAMVKGGKTWVVKETTANGAGTPHHQAWMKAIRGESGYKWHFFGWHLDPLNLMPGAQPFELTDDEKEIKESHDLTWEQLAWRRQKIASMARPELFAQEYPLTWEEAFLSSGASLFNASAIKRLDENRREPKWRGNIVDRGGMLEIVPSTNGPLIIYATPDARTRYLVTVDVADGVEGAAFSVADVYDIRTWEQVAQWRGHADPLAFEDVVAKLGAFYNWALVAVEDMYPGNAVIGGLNNRRYPNLYTEDGGVGFKTTLKTKSEYVSDGRAAIRDGSLKINSPTTLNEMRTFILAENGRMEPQPGCWQDTVIVACKAANILKTLRLEPEIKRASFREVMNLGRRNGNGMTGGNFGSRVV